MDRSSPPLHRAWPALSVLMAAGLALRLYRLDFQSLWLDEVLTFQTASLPLTQILFDPMVDRNFPPLHSSLVHLFIAMLGNTDWAVRLPSVLAGTISIPLQFAVVRYWFGPMAALTAAGLLALSPLHVWYSQEARPYALLIALGLASLWFAQRVVQRPSAIPAQIGFIVTASATLYTHVLALPYLGLLAVYGLASIPRGARLRWLLLVCGIVLLIAPQLYQFVSVPPDESANSLYRFHPLHVAYTLWTFGTGFSLGPSVIELRAGMAGVTRYLWLILPITCVLAVLLLIGASRLWQTTRLVFWMVVLWFIIPVAFAALGAIYTDHAYNVRYVLLSFPAFLLVLSLGVSSGPTPAFRASGLAFMVIVSAAALLNYYTHPKYQRDDNRRAVAFLNASTYAGAPLIVSAPYTALALRHYRLRPDLALETYPPSGGLVEPGEVASDLDRLTARHDQIWLFLSRTFHSDPTGEIERYFDTYFLRDETHAWAGVRVLVYGRRRQPASNEEE